MKINESYAPEGRLGISPPQELAALRQAAAERRVFEAVAASCTAAHELVVPLGTRIGIIAREECAIGIDDGTTREIAILSRVGKPVCFCVCEVHEDTLVLSRRDAQEQALGWFLSNLKRGDVVRARVTHLENFGVFVDIGCGVTALIGIENLSISRIWSPAERLSVGQDIYAVVLDIDRRLRRITLTHRELLGTWSENVARFSPGETVQGIVRSVESYGVFIELTPNLSGLAERREGLRPGQAVSVYIKSILPERMKIKLAIIDVLGPAPVPEPPRYFLPEGRLDSWIYTPDNCLTKFISTEFNDSFDP